MGRRSATIRWGKGARIEEGALVGVVPMRKVKRLATVIGNNARCLAGAVVYLGSRIGKNLLVTHHAVIREENVIGDDFCLWNNSIVDYGCRIGNRVKVHGNCYVAQGSVLEDDVFLAPGVILGNDMHPGCSLSKRCLAGPVIRKGAQIGCNATILPGVTIGAKALVGAGSVVTKDVPAGAVVAGNPAWVVKQSTQIACNLVPGKHYRSGACPR